MELGQKIKTLREQRGMTLEELGEKVGVGKSTVRKWETGMIANMRRDKIAKIAAALDTDPAYLMGWTSPSIVDRKFTHIQEEMNETFSRLSDTNQNKVLIYSKNLLSTQQMEEAACVPVAAHERTDVNVTDEMKKHDDDIMNDDSKWE